MRAFVFAIAILASSGFSPSIAQEIGSSSTAGSPTPVQTDRAPQPQKHEPLPERDQSQAINGEVDRDCSIKRRDGDYAGRNDRDMVSNSGMHRKHHGFQDRANDRTKYGEVDGYSDGRTDQGRAYQGNNSRRRVKVCIEYENGDEFCSYRHG